VKKGSVGRGTGVHIRIVDADGRRCSAGAEEEVWVLGPTVARGYLGNPTETARSFVAGWFRTGDLGSIDQDGYLFLTGRIKNVIDRGGLKISPEYVEAVLAECSGVTEAVVFAVPDATFGERVGAAVVVSRTAVRIGTDPAKVPRQAVWIRDARTARSRCGLASHRQGRARPARSGGPVRTPTARPDDE